jgi:tetratricopeptide (TPR) repeat protein
MKSSNALSNVLRNVIAIGCLVTVCAGTDLQTYAAAQKIDYARELSQAHLFLQPLICTGTNAPDPEEAHDLYAAAGLDPENQAVDRLASIESYIRAHPKSPWVPSLCANLARFYRSQGRYSAALDAWQQAWDDTKDSPP